MTIKRAFKGVWVPREIWVNKELTWMEKLFLVEINSLDNKKGCYASNPHFAGFFQLSSNRCSEIIKSLITKKYITAQYERNGKEIKKRILKISNKRTRDIDLGTRDIDLGTRDIEEGYSRNTEERDTKSNNTDNNTKEKENSSFPAPLEVLPGGKTQNEEDTMKKIYPVLEQFCLEFFSKESDAEKVYSFYKKLKTRSNRRKKMTGAEGKSLADRRRKNIKGLVESEGEEHFLSVIDRLIESDTLGTIPEYTLEFVTNSVKYKNKHKNEHKETYYKDNKKEKESKKSVFVVPIPLKRISDNEQPEYCNWLYKCDCGEEYDAFVKHKECPSCKATLIWSEVSLPNKVEEGA